MRRGFGRLFRRGPGGVPQAPAVLQRANQLMAAGNYHAAATAFEDLAKQAEARSGPRAPFFFLQAGRACMLTGECERCTAHFKHGLTLLADSQRYTQFYRAGTRVIQELKAHKMENEAGEISALIHGHTVAIAEMNTQQLPEEQPLLPTHCPACGGPIRSDEVDWIDDQTAECQFCGSPVRAG
ncbi:MAG: hypothetical protein WA821_05410 [Anaerolineales bacterium]